MRPAFPEAVEALITGGQITVATAKFLAGLTEESRTPLLRLFGALRFGVNKQREIVEWLEDVLHRDGLSVPDLCQKLGLEELLSDTALNAPQKCTRFRERLHTLRYPVLSAHLHTLHRTMRNLRLPDGVRLSVESPLEDAVFRLEIEFKSQAELAEKLKALPVLPLD